MLLEMAKLALLAAMPLTAFAVPSLEVRQSQRVTVDLTKTYQTMDGFGFSAAFQRANLIVNLQGSKQREVLDLLFNTTTVLVSALCAMALAQRRTATTIT
jgi:O-glycosyl hydrolase